MDTVGNHDIDAGSLALLEAMELTPSVADLIAEDTSVNGIRCFQFEAMVIPADAISRNTVSGKKGPTYYSARRTRQYTDRNNAIIEELAARGQRVTIYPRHAAAMLDAALPSGWVERYFTRPSKRAVGREDVWYQGCIPLETSDGRDIYAKLKTGLVQFSSLRTFGDGSFRTEPVRVNGQLVEEAIDLPIAGIDLVATQPGLPVEPIRILEEAAIIEPATEDAMTAPMPPHAGPPAAQQPQQPQGQQQGQQAQLPGASQVPQQYAHCPSCGADITHHILAAHTMMMAQGQGQGQQQPQQQGQPQQQQQAPQQGQGQPPQQRGAREEELTAQNVVLQERIVALTAELEANTAMDPTKQASAAAEGDGANNTAELSAALTAALAKIAALEAENTAKAAGLEEMQQYVADARKRDTRAAVIARLVAEDKTMGARMQTIVEEATAQEFDELKIEVVYWKLRTAETEKLMANSRNRLMPAGFGHTALSGVEETSAAGGVGKAAADAGDPAKRGDKYAGTAAGDVRAMFRRVG